MKDLQKIKEFFSKPLKEERDIYDEIANEEFGMDYDQLGPNEKEWVRDEISNMDEAVTAAYESVKEGNHNAEDFKPYVVKDRNNPNFLRVFIQYPTGTGFTTALGQRTMTGQDREYGAAKAMKMGQAVAAKLESKYNIEDIEVSDNDAGKVIVFAVSDDFIKMNTPSIDEAKDPDHLEKVRNIAKSLPHRYNIKPNMGMVKVTSRSKDELVDLKTELAKANLYSEMRPTLAGMFELTVLDSPVNEAKKEDAVDTITMDVPLFLRMLEYSREDASQDMDLHDITEKAILLNKKRGILQMDDYEEIVGAAEDISKNEMKEMDYGSALMRNLMPGADVLKKYANTLIMDPKIASASTEQEFRGLLRNKIEKAQWFGKDEVSQAAERVLSFGNNAGKYSNTIARVFNMVKGKFVNEETLTEANIPSNIKDFAKRKGVSSLVNKVAGWAEKVGARIAGGTAVGKNYSTLVLDLDYKQQGEIRINTDDNTITLYDEPVRSFNDFQRVYADGEDNNLEEGMGGQLDEPFFIQVSVRNARKAMDMFNDMYRNSNIKTYGSDVYAADTPEDIYDLFYDLNSQGIEILDANIEDDEDFYDSEYEKTLGENVAPNHDGKAAPYGSGYKPLEERIAKALDQINEELCPAGKAYIKRRQAAGEKSSAYLSGRGVKVCKGQMSGRAKKKK
jgi:hypothetical protein